MYLHRYMFEMMYLYRCMFDIPMQVYVCCAQSLVPHYGSPPVACGGALQHVNGVPVAHQHALTAQVTLHLDQLVHLREANSNWIFGTENTKYLYVFSELRLTLVGQLRKYTTIIKLRYPVLRCNKHESRHTAACVNQTCTWDCHYHCFMQIKASLP